jgi:transposase-like protein
VDPRDQFCPNFDCPAKGQAGKGNIHVHSRKERRYRCDVCAKTFGERVGTAFERLHKDEQVMTTVVTLLAHGCPPQAIVAAFDLDERTVKDWTRKAGQQAERVHTQLVEQPRELGQVPADEIRVKVQGRKVVWVAMALQVRTRLWLGATLSPHRNMELIVALIQIVRACALCRPMLFCMDGLAAYIGAIRTVFSERIPRRGGEPGRCRLRLWDGIHIAQVVKQYSGRCVTGIERRIVQGTLAEVQRLIRQTQGMGEINTAYIERLNATFRQRLASLVRRGRALACHSDTLHHAVYLLGALYNFCTYHESLAVQGLIGGHKWLPRTPAMAAGISDHRWTVRELLAYKVPPTRWTPPKRRGRPSKATQALVARWCS